MGSWFLLLSFMFIVFFFDIVCVCWCVHKCFYFYGFFLFEHKNDTRDDQCIVRKTTWNNWIGGCFIDFVVVFRCKCPFLHICVCMIWYQVHTYGSAFIYYNDDISYLISFAIKIIKMISGLMAVKLLLWCAYVFFAVCVCYDGNVYEGINLFVA